MEPPATLPAQLYLIAYDLHRQRLTARSQLGYVMRAAALEDLRQSGHIDEDDGKVRVKIASPPTDPVLADVHSELVAGRARSWRHWVRAKERATGHSVRDQLDDRMYLRVEPRRILGIFPTATITARDPGVIEMLQRQLLNTLDSVRPVSEAKPRQTALVALAAVGELDAVLPRALRRVHKRRIAEFVERAGPVPPALRTVIQEMRAAAAG